MSEYFEPERPTLNTGQERTCSDNAGRLPSECARRQGKDPETEALGRGYDPAVGSWKDEDDPKGGGAPHDYRDQDSDRSHNWADVTDQHSGYFDHEDSVDGQHRCFAHVDDQYFDTAQLTESHPGYAMPDAVESPEPYPDPNWRSRLAVNKDGQPYAVLGNAIRTLQFSPTWHGVFQYDSFSDIVVVAKANPYLRNTGVGKPITDADVAFITSALMDDGLRFTSRVVFEAISSVSKDHLFHPVKDYLESLEHDGCSRVGTWLSDYCNASRSKYSMAVGQCWLISAVARIFQPGCKADCCLILEGPQGSKKSTALRILGGDWFSDAVTDITTKDAKIAMRGAWIFELSELAALNRKEAADVKAFMSTAVDRYRPVYGRSAINYPRQCVYAGTVNHSTYFNDETGLRRFWSVEVRGINAAALEMDRDQIWAEAVALYKAGVPWHLNTPELVAEAEKQQRAKLETDVWQERIESYCANRPFVSVSEILEKCIQKPVPQQTQSDKNRVARCLQVAGYERFRASSGGGRHYLYRRVETSGS